MPACTTQRLRQEVDLMERFTETYRRKFASLIDRMNRSQPTSDLQCVRLCVEAVDMMLASQSPVAQEPPRNDSGPQKTGGLSVQHVPDKVYRCCKARALLRCSLFVGNGEKCVKGCSF